MTVKASNYNTFILNNYCIEGWRRYVTTVCKLIVFFTITEFCRTQFVYENTQNLIGYNISFILILSILLLCLFIY